MDWIEAVRAEEDIKASFIETMTALRNRALRQMEQARSWEEVLEARGQKKFADQMLAFVTMIDDEERAYLRFRQGGQ